MSAAVNRSRSIGKIKVIAADHSRADLQRESDRISARGRAFSGPAFVAGTSFVSRCWSASSC